MAEREQIPSFRRLRAFDTVAQTASLSAAAQALGLSQPALTHTISQLEGALDARLFDRRPEGTFLNEAGVVFRHRTQRFFAQLGQAVSGVAVRPLSAPALQAMAGKISTAQARNLLAIWRHGSFRAAARALDLSEPSLQRPARELEQLLGRALYRRAAIGLTVNEEGAELARRIALAIGEIRSGAEEVGLATQARASLRIGVLALAPRTLLARAAARLLEQDRTHKVEVIEGAYTQLIHDLNNGAIDLIVGALRAPPPHADLEEERLFEDPYAIVCRRDHPLRRLPHVGPDDLARYDWIFPDEGLPRRAVLNALLKGWSQQPAVQFETTCLATISALLATSDRVSILSHWHIELDGHLELARVESLDLAHPPRFVGLTYRRTWLPTPFQAEFLKHIRSAAQRLTAGAQPAPGGAAPPAAPA